MRDMPLCALFLLKSKTRSVHIVFGPYTICSPDLAVCVLRRLVGAEAALAATAATVATLHLVALDHRNCNAWGASHTRRQQKKGGETK